MTIQEYLSKVETLYRTGNAREHSYRGDLQNLIMAILPDVLVTNEPARVDCGAPDYVLTRKDVPIGYIEAKDIGVDLGSKTLKEQFDRYKSGLSNLVFTDYLDFHFYKEGELTTKIAIAKIENGSIIPHPENFEQFTQLIKNFAETISQTIKSPTSLAHMMAGKAKLMADVIEKSLDYDDKAENRSQLKNQMLSFQSMLIHDIDNKSFSDIYAQTIAYGMFAARYHDPTLPTFSRMEAAELIPKSNPFLRKLFQDIAGFDLDNRLVWIVDELVNIFLASDVAQIMKNFGKSTKQEDPVVHFYETFLGEYNPALRKARGVWYTPQPVVNFIVRAVDDILKTEFNLPQGLADTSKTKVKVDYYGKKIEKEVHKVQILDPATGTGTFLAEVVKHIYKKFEGQQGIWSKYVTNDLIPRLNGFELLMASYAMAHLKMDMLLTETGYKPIDDQRFKIFLTNSLEEAHQDSGTLFSSWLSDESNQANEIKRDTPVMVIIGNPPYSGESANKGEWIMNLMEDYKKEPGGTEKLKEQTSKWINDDYVKFLRFGQHFIEKNGEGVLAFINPHGFLDNPTFRGMRWNLLKTYGKIYTIDLHGNSKKKETAPDGTIDQNVFDIMQGVSINLFIKNKMTTNEIGKVFHFDLFGKRENKYEFLLNNSLNTINFKELELKEPYFTFGNTNIELYKEYESNILLSELFKLNGNGVTTAHDTFVIKNSYSEAFDFFNDFKNSERDEDILHKKFEVKKKNGWSILDGYDNLQKTDNVSKFIRKIAYRPFDDKVIFFEDKLVWRTVRKIMNHYIIGDNIGLLTTKSLKDKNFNHIFITNTISEAIFLSGSTGSNAMNFPLYLYPFNKEENSLIDSSRVANLNEDKIKIFEDCTGLKFTIEKEETPKTFAPIDILDYIYAVLHSPSYRQKYEEFLKIDFPRVPAPLDHEMFWKLVKLGGEIRQIHLLESPTVEKYITGYPEDGDNVVTKPTYKNGCVYINETQYFSNVPEVAWNFYIGGYQPAQKWLKDRKDRELKYEEILHYQKIIVSLSETDRIMKEIDKIKI